MDYNSNDMASVLAYIKKQNGNEPFESDQVLILFKEYAPNLDREAAVLKKLIETGQLKKLIKADSQSEAKRLETARQAVWYLTDKELVMQNIAQHYVQLITDVLGWNIEIFPSQDIEEPYVSSSTLNDQSFENIGTSQSQNTAAANAPNSFYARNKTIIFTCVVLVAVVIVALIIFVSVRSDDLKRELQGVWYTSNDLYGQKRLWYFDSDTLIADNENDGAFYSSFNTYTLDGNHLTLDCVSITRNGQEADYSGFYGLKTEADISIAGDTLTVDLTNYLAGTDIESYTVNKVFRLQRENISYHEAVQKYFGQTQ